MDRLLNVDELAQILGVKKSWLYEMARPGNLKLPCIKVGKYTRFKLAEVLQFLEEQQNETKCCNK